MVLRVDGRGEGHCGFKVPWVRRAPAGGIFAGQPPGYGFSLPVVYLVWIAIVTFCCFPCKWFAGVEQRSRGPWLSYL
jgi:hypothetical protein